MRHLQAVEVRYGIEPRGPLDLSNPVFSRRGHPPERFLGFAAGLRRLLVEAVTWKEKHPLAGKRQREKTARRFERRIPWLVTHFWGDPDVERIGTTLEERMDALFTFVRIPAVPWHNNAAESGIRSVVVKRKVSGGLRSAKGAWIYSVLKSVHETCKKTGRSFVEFVLETFGRRITEGQPSTASTP